MFQSKKPNSACGVRRARKFCLRTDVSRDMRCSGTLDTQLPRDFAEHATHHFIVEDGRSFDQSQWNLSLTS